MSTPVTSKPRCWGSVPRFASISEIAPCAQPISRILSPALGRAKCAEKYRIDVDAQAAFFVGLDEAQRAVHKAVRFHYDQSSSRTPTTCESPFS